MTIRPAREEHADVVTDLLRLSIPEEVVPLTPIGQKGAFRWVRDRLRDGEHRFRGVHNVREDPPVGIAEWRVIDGSLFLNSIAVAPDYRGRGFGAALLQDGVTLPTECDHVQLDVFSHARTARAWYRDLGFAPIGRRRWWHMPLEAGPMHRPSDVTWSWADTDPSRRQHDRYGFSNASLQTPTSTYRVGRLGTSLVRLTSPAALTDPVVWAALRASVPRRDVLYISPAMSSSPHIPVPTGAECRAESIRLSVSRDRLCLALSPTPDEI